MGSFGRVVKILLVVIAGLGVACTATKQATHYPATTQLPPLANDSLRAIFHYTEALTGSLFMEDTAVVRSELRKALEYDSLLAPSLYEMAQSYIDSPAEGLPYARKAVEQDGDNVIFKGLLARYLTLAGEYTEATRVYEQLVKEEPRNVLNYRMLAALYDQERQPFSAISVLDSAEVKLGRVEELTYYKRELLMRVGLYDRGEAESKRLIEEYPYDYRNYLMLAELYANQNSNDSLTLATYNKALEVDSMAIPTLRSKMAWHIRKGHELDYLSVLRRLIDHPEVELGLKNQLYTEATANETFYRNNFWTINGIVSSFILQYPDNYDVIEHYTTHLIRSGEVEQAITIYKGYSERHPESLEALYNIIDGERYLERRDSMMFYTNLAISFNPENPDLYMRRGFYWSELGAMDRAIDDYGLAMKHAPTDSVRSTVMGTIGDLYHQQGDSKKAYKYYRKALKIFDRNVAVLNNYAYYLCEQGGDLDKAYEMSVKACELEPSNATYLDTKGWILYRLGRYEEAKPVMLQAVSLDKTGSTVLLMHYGDVLYALGEEFMAGVYWRRALSGGHDPAEVNEKLKLLE
ncbi:MAG: tetratricopeptide repeat protein [Tidjanibacter sp.]|nr:tetratricopeptide repeat protein [Tidjanibacter sp.]